MAQQRKESFEEFKRRTQVEPKAPTVLTGTLRPGQQAPPSQESDESPLGKLARSLPIRGRNLPVTIGSLAPSLKALRRLTLQEK